MTLNWSFQGVGQPPKLSAFEQLWFNQFVYMISGFSIQDWKAGGEILEQVRAYDPVPPPAQDCDLSKYPLKLASVTKDETKRGWAKYKISLPHDVRSRCMADAVHGGQWRDLILDFDKKFPV